MQVPDLLTYILGKRYFATKMNFGLDSSDARCIVVRRGRSLHLLIVNVRHVLFPPLIFHLNYIRCKQKQIILFLTKKDATNFRIPRDPQTPVRPPHPVPFSIYSLCFCDGHVRSLPPRHHLAKINSKE